MKDAPSRHSEGSRAVNFQSALASHAPPRPRPRPDRDASYRPPCAEDRVNVSWETRRRIEPPPQEITSEREAEGIG